MEDHKSIEKLFTLYIGKHFSKKGRALFARWFRAEDAKEEKEAQLFHYWNETDNLITQETFEDWESLRARLPESNYEKRRFLFPYIKYAAAIALLVVSIGTTYWVTANQPHSQAMANLIELSTPYGKTECVTLPDGSKVWLNAGSTLIYPESFDHMNCRDIYLSGEASFDVFKNKEKPFIVKTADLYVQALGTLFTVEAYPNEKVVRTVLEEGSVKVDIKDAPEMSHILKPSECLTYSNTTQEVTVEKVDLKQYALARQGVLFFENAPLSKILQELEKKYGISFVYRTKLNSTEIYNMRFNQNESITDVMNVLSVLMDIKYTIKGKQIIIK